MYRNANDGIMIFIVGEFIGKSSDKLGNIFVGNWMELWAYSL